MVYPGRSTNASRRGSGKGRRWPAAVLAATIAGLGLLGAGAPAASAEELGFCPDGTQAYAPVAEVEAFAPGEVVTGLSVTHGTAPDEFTGKYIGFIDDALGKGKDLLLFRLSSPIIDGTEATGGLKGAGIWAGMSGSPVYTGDGRLIGAVAYSLTSENLPIAGVTPAEYMRSIGTTALTTTSLRVTTTNLRASAAGTTVGDTALVGSTFSQVRTVNIAGAAGGRQNAFANRTLARTPRSAAASSFLRSGGFVPAAAESSALTEPLVAGGTLAATYTSGDFVFGAIGTVTAVCGDTVWAFGHPMSYEGAASMLMANASTVMIVPDGAGLSGSYKQVSQLGEPVGMITQDRRVGIRGTVGAVRAFGIDVDVQDASGAQVGSYHVGVADPELAASAAAGMIGQAAYERLDQYSSGTAEISWTIGYRREDGTEESLTNFQVVADRSAFPDVVATDLAEEVWAITDNEFEDVAITGIQVTLRLLDSDAITYRTSDVELLSKGTWTSLSGRRLKAGRSYSVRPAYRIQLNGKLRSTTVVGEPVTFRLPSTARRSGTFLVAPANDAGDDCYVDPSGDIYCEDWDYSEESGFGGFDELIAGLDALEPDSSVVGELRYRRTRGTSLRGFDWTGPGVVTGSVKAYFSIRS